MIGKGATPSFFAIANDNYTLTPCIRYIYCYINEKAGIFFANFFATEFIYHIFKEE